MKYVGFMLALLTVSNSYAYLDVNAKNKPAKGNSIQNQSFTGKANCAPPNEKLIFQFNDVRAQLNTNGVLFMIVQIEWLHMKFLKVMLIHLQVNV